MIDLMAVRSHGSCGQWLRISTILMVSETRASPLSMFEAREGSIGSDCPGITAGVGFSKRRSFVWVFILNEYR